ncbi:CamS family sex pheromone protein [Microaerobacter geothermalis]|uniref:CamS family sex pheromone protein n=1 Tax=Microaerobacter geothermalis TaxID=674972 RepID=UPI001F1CC690|nr:CamS family sex pheromone protein [Microaerobacter geothermalis]MCF6094461.1 CamS family sex pheromone protein [Microaerobacter geothermalis]
MKKYLFPVVAMIFLLSGCSLFQEKEAEPNVIKPNISPNIEVTEKYYPGVLPYQPNQSRGTLTRLNSRLDASRLELGLLEIAQQTFPINQYVFREGQFLTKGELESWLARKTPENLNGLNPSEGTPFLYHILEHNYLSKDGTKVEGIVIALSFSSQYETPQGETKEYLPEEMLSKTKGIANLVVQRLRQKVTSVPIIVALFQMEPKPSLIPGRFISVGTVNGNEETISKWKEMNEKYVLYPSNKTLEGIFLKTQRDFTDFKNEVQGFYQNFAGIIGMGRFVEGELVELTVTVTTEFDSKTEIIQMTQFIASILPKYFPDNTYINVYVNSISRPQAIYVRPNNGEPFFHVYRD